MEIIFYIFYFVLSVLSLLYLFYKYKFLYWSNRGVPYIEPKIPLGNLSPDLPIMELLSQAYSLKTKNSPYIGIYNFFSPTAVITNLDLVKNILIKDFNYFIDRGQYHNEKVDPLSGHLFNLDGEKWKNLRSKLSPTFTSGKMKYMFPTIVNVADEFHSVLNELIQNSNDIEMKDLLARFTTDVIGTCAFGIECNSLKDPDAEFRKYGRSIFETPQNRISRIFKVQFREFAKFLRLRNVRKPLEKFFLNVVRQTVQFREENNIKRNDFMDLLIELKNGKVENKNFKQLTIEEMAAQVFVFFLAGFETSSSTISFCLYELALKQNLQDKLRTEINEVLKKHNGKFTYEAMIEMTYLEQVVNETLRMYPPVILLARQAVKDYKVPNHDNLVIEKGTKVFIPAYEVHHDPQIYPNPNTFNPDNFHPDAIQGRHSLSFLGFGDGPRNCIGLRFGKMQTKVGLVTLLQNFKIFPCDKTQIPLKFNRKIPLLTPEGGNWLKIKKV